MGGGDLFTAFQKHGDCIKDLCRGLCGQGLGRASLRALSHEGLVEHWDPEQGGAFPVLRASPIVKEVPPMPAPVPGVRAGPDGAGQADTVSSVLGTAQGSG